jgi:hypothetical protein
MDDRSAYERGIREEKELLQREEDRLEKEQRKYYDEHSQLQYKLYNLQSAVDSVKYKIEMNSYENEALRERLAKYEY